jgi:DNA-binding NtrC family response regulator
MPGLTGVELLKKLRSARKGLPVIMAAGMLPAQELAQNPWLEPVALLAKPYDANQLLERVHDVLHKAPKQISSARG